MGDMIHHKSFEAEVKAADDANLVIEHFISTETKDREGDIMRVDGMKIVGKPVVLMAHGRGPMGSEPIAKPLSIGAETFKGRKGILAKTQFFPDELGRRLYAKAKDGYAPNWSIGYSVQEAKDLQENGRYMGRDVLKWQLFEYSMVGVPMNPDAHGPVSLPTKKEDGFEAVAFKIMSESDQDAQETQGDKGEGEGKGAREKAAASPASDTENKENKGDPDSEDKAAVPYKKTPLAPEGEKWDGPGQVKAATPKQLKTMCVWWDPEKPDLKTSYKGPHHKADEEFSCVWSGVKACAAAMMGARGGMKVPQEDMPKMMAHIEKHYADFGKGDPPWKTKKGMAFLVAVKCLEDQRDQKLLADAFLPDLAEFFTKEAATKEASVEEKVSALETSLKTVLEKLDAIERLPGAPEPGNKAAGGAKENPPEVKQRPRLVFVNDEPTEAQKQAAKQAQVDAVRSAVKEVLGERVQAELDRMRGKVP